MADALNHTGSYFYGADPVSGTQLAQLAVTGAAPECNPNDTTGCTETFVYRTDGTPLELRYTPAGTGTAQRYCYEVDGRGNVVALTDTGGNVVDRYEYDPWGAPTFKEQVPQPLWYAGYVYDRELGWYGLSTRTCDPTLKRFLQPDPSEQEAARGVAR